MPVRNGGRKSLKGKPIRFRSVDNLITEIKEVIEHYPFIKTLNFDDDMLFLNRS